MGSWLIKMTTRTGQSRTRSVRVLLTKLDADGKQVVLKFPKKLPLMDKCTSIDNIVPWMIIHISTSNTNNSIVAGGAMFHLLVRTRLSPVSEPSPLRWPLGHELHKKRH